MEQNSYSCDDHVRQENCGLNNVIGPIGLLMDYLVVTVILVGQLSCYCNAVA